ncbi:MAG: hypothetical protein L0H79_15240 [Intrasporangium sp.]|uniref:glycosyltransferase n=1 Tax=Intrasporangium sp. TaxID=1925024 RepID=UPI002647E16B|nr:nucleotide disphospho-sugar-binding domain-containing protein [Intrasporangium sp.]MDN5797095.1 hypothetical protein [Intrasporangium sp.]
MTLGSLPAHGQVPAAVEGALRESRRRAILQGDALRGVAERLATDVGDDQVLHVDDVPHDWLLPRTAVVVHQAGAGISSAALRAGVPSVTVPMHTDQPFWARRLETLSAGTAPLPMKRLTAAALATRLDEATSCDLLRKGAGRVARVLQDEEGTAPLRSWLHQLDG